MIPEAPFLFSTAGLSLSLAGLAGLVATLRRDTGFSDLDRYRLREIVEFSFANALLALSLIPLNTTLGDLTSSVRVAAAVAILYQLTFVTILVRRQRARGLATTRAWIAIAVTANVLIFIAALACVVTGAIGAYQWLLVGLLARPMLAFVLVLGSFERGE